MSDWDFNIVQCIPANEYLELRLNFQNCDARLIGLWGQFYTDADVGQGPAYFYELKPASVGLTLYWPNGIPSDTWVDVWLENDDGSFSTVYTLLIPVGKEIL
jgi:hypothetical protein